VNILTSAVTDNDFVTADVLIKLRTGRAQKRNIILFRFKDSFYAYDNLCMHMRRPLNCQANAIFDRERQHLRCSMHGFVFEPETGICLSPVCAGQKLQTVKLIEADGMLSLPAKQGQITAIYRNGVELL
jgi:nitrite reductase/ring-hydroxylating ferredoxin subunit